MKKTVAFLVLITTLTGCVEEYDLNLAEAPPRLVVEGLITNEKGPYYIRLTESHSGKFDIDLNYYSGIKDALVIVSDNVNQIDTLVLLDNLEDYEYNWMYGYYKPVYDDFGNVIDTIPLAEPANFYGRGFYKTQNLEGIPGRTYSLKIIYKKEEYRADAYMPPAPDIDSLGIMRIITPEGKDDYFSPLLYFSEPQETKDYYLIQFVNEVSARTSYRWSFYWPFSILSDEFLEPYVNGLHIGSGANLLDYEGSPIYSDGNIYVRLNSLTREAYLYYKSLIQQFENDGGSFQPTPASAPTNISNGALGFFRASAVSEKSLVVNHFNGLQLEILTQEATEITATTAVSGGELNDNFYALATTGICWSTNPNPTTDDFSIAVDVRSWRGDSFKMTNLTPNTKYYVRAFAMDVNRIAHYGKQVEFTTLAE